MKKDIEIPIFFGVYIAVISEGTDEGNNVWNAYIINNKDEPIENVLISSKGYLINVKGEESKSSTLRHFYKNLPARSSRKIEVLIHDVLKLNNEYFVSFYCGGKLFDKKFVFLAETISIENVSIVPIIQKEGVWIK